MKKRYIPIILMMSLFSYSLSSCNSVDNNNNPVETTETYKYEIKIDLDGGTSQKITSNVINTNEFSVNILPFDVKKDNLAFKGYELNGIKVYDENKKEINTFRITTHMTFKAIFSEDVNLNIKYSLYNPKTYALVRVYDNVPQAIGNFSESKTYKYNDSVVLNAKTFEGYDFLGWYKNDKEESKDPNYKIEGLKKDTTLEARIAYKMYNVNISTNNKDAGLVLIKNNDSLDFKETDLNESFYKENVTVIAKSKTEKNFYGWFLGEELVSKDLEYTFEMPKSNINLTARWNLFKIEYDLDGGINDINNPLTFSNDMDSITLYDAKKDGAIFAGWYLDGEKIDNLDVKNIKKNVTLKAKWDSYKLTTSTNILNAGVITKYNEEQVITGTKALIEAKANLGYKYLGLYDKEGNLITIDSSYEYTMQAYDMEIVAYFEKDEIMNDYEFISTDKTCKITKYVNEEKTTDTLPQFVTEIGDSAYKNSNIDTIYLPIGITSIYKDAFNNKLKNVYYDGNMNNWLKISFENINSNPMTYANNLYLLNNESYDLLNDEITISDEITKINPYAFSGFNNLKKINISNNVIEIGQYAFNKCTNLKEINIPNNIEIIEEYTFNNCESLNNIILPNNLLSIKKGAFIGCNSLEEIKISDSVTSISDSAFEGCKNLKNVELSDNLTIISKYLFQGCENLENIRLKSNIISVKEQSFVGCKNLANIYYDSDINGFLNISFLKSDILANGAKLYFIDKENKDDSITYGNNKYKIFDEFNVSDNIEIGKYQFYGYQYFKNIIISNNIKLFGESAFENAKTIKLELVKKPENYSDSAFKGLLTNEAKITTELLDLIDTSNLEKIELISGSSIKDEAFKDATGLKDVILCDTINYIGSYAFSGCENLEEITIPDGVTTIGAYAFNGCAKLNNVVIPNNITKINNFTFANCTSLSNIILPNKLEVIGDYAFNGCKLITTLNISNTLNEIGYSAFAGCELLENIVIPKNVSRIESSTFYGCKKITSLDLSNVTFIGDHAFKDCTSLKSINNALNLEVVDIEAFSGCEKLDTIDLSHARIINQRAFAATKLSEANITNLIEKIGDGAFAATQIKSLTILDNLNIDNENEEERIIVEIGANILTNTSLDNLIIELSDVSNVNKDAFSGAVIKNIKANTLLIPFVRNASFKEIEITSGDTIDSNSFKNKTLDKVILPNTITTIKDSAFSGATIDNLYMPSILSSVVDSAFKTTTIKNCSIDTSSIKYITLNQNQKNNLESLEILSGDTIEENAFINYTSLKEVIIHESITDIKANAFNNCTNLSDIYNLSSLEFTVGSDTFGCIAKYATNIYTSLE